MKKILGIITAGAIAFGFLGGFTYQTDNGIEDLMIHSLVVRIDEETDANERLVAYIYELESDNVQLREENTALIASNNALIEANQELLNREPEVED